MNRLTQKQETFTQNLFKGMSQREAWVQAGYSSNYAPAIIDVNACRLANSNKVQLRWGELRQAVEDASISTVTERKQRLTELAKETIKQPVTAKEVVSSIAELNKMEKIYTEGAVNINNQIININVLSENARKATERIIEGERTE